MSQKIAQHRLRQIEMFESLIKDLGSPLGGPGGTIGWEDVLGKMNSIAEKAAALEFPGVFDYNNGLDNFRVFLIRASFTDRGKVSTLSAPDRQRILDVLGASSINNGSNSLMRLQTAASAAKILGESLAMKATLESIKKTIMRDAEIQSDDGETDVDSSEIDRPKA